MIVATRTPLPSAAKSEHTVILTDVGSDEDRVRLRWSAASDVEIPKRGLK